MLKYPFRLWVLRVYFFFVAAVLPIALLLPESHGLTILSRRAKRYRGLGIRNARAAHELDEETTLHFFQAHLGRPLCTVFSPLNGLSWT